MDIYHLEGFEQFQPMVVSLRCPSCHQHGTFEPVGTNDVRVIAPNVRLGQRRCPNPSCFAHVFVAQSNQTGELIAAHPPQRVDFDATNLPTDVLKALEEAITCHSNECYVASAIMVRKTLEELCDDQQAKGDDLKARIKDLGAKVVIPKELFDGLDDIRLLGNDAAHVEAKVYGEIGKDEVEIGIEFTKEVLKAVYQYSALLARLQGLKKGAQQPPAQP